MPVRKDISQRVTVSTVRDAYLRGDFERCIAFCDEYRARNGQDEVEVELLRARALMPLNRADSALDVLRRLRLVEGAGDEYLVAKMLTGAAYVKLGHLDRGLEILRDAHGAAGTAHPTIRADIAVNLGIARYRKRQYAQALAVLQSVPKGADIVYARAVLYTAWVAWGQGEYATAADRFEGALQHIEGCRHYDRYVEAYALYGYALLCAELPRLHLWKPICERIARFDWGVTGLALPRFWLMIAASYITEMLGTMDDARHWASQAEDSAPSPSCRIVAWCRLAALFGRYGEAGAHAYFVDKARERYESLGREDALREERSLPLTLAEETVQTSAPDDTEALLTYYVEVQVPLLKEDPDEPKLEAYRDFIEAMLYDAHGERTRAQRRYASAFRRFRALGFGRSASIVAYRLAGLTDDAQYRAFADDALRDASASYWVKDRFAQQKFEIRLTAAQADVLRLVALGMTNKQIAAARGISFFRARNIVADLLAAFGVNNRVDLGRIAAARSQMTR
ncbi:MAG: LuxR C-terminal-related transcriptional regulator [Candidatus Eremiobacteraeota bacterium]|nr:LuxR C-terminal-related transcriptional regulator [Candidatus Eremiobacteraeota bacterium]